MTMRILLTVALVAPAFTSAAHAAWVLIDDFESTPVGEYLGDGVGGTPAADLTGWIATSKYRPDGQSDFQVILDPLDATNRAMMSDATGSTGGGGNQYTVNNVSAAISIPEGSTGTLSMRILAVDGLDSGAGLSDGTETTKDNIKPGFLTGQGDPPEDLMNARKDTNLFSVAADTWYVLWMVVDNAADTYDLYVQGGAFPAQTQVADDEPFRSGTTDALTTLVVGYWRDDHNGLVYDDFYIDTSGENLSMAPEPAAVGLLGLGGALILGRRRRR